MAPSPEQLKVSYEGLRAIIEKLEKKIENHEKMAGQLVGAYIFFEAFVLSTVSRSPSFELHKKWWIPFSLSLLVSIMFWVTITTIIRSYLEARYHFDTTWMEQQDVYLQMSLARDGHIQTEMSSDHSICTALQQQQRPRGVLKPNIIIRYQRYAYLYVIVICLLASTFLMLHACSSMRFRYLMGQRLNHDEYDSKMKKYKSIIDKQEQRIQHLQSTAFQLANFYFVFQGVIFTAISNGTTSLTCHESWIPIVLSLITATTNLIAIFIIGQQYKKSLRLRDESIKDHNQLASQGPQIFRPDDHDVPPHDDHHVQRRRSSSDTEIQPTATTHNLQRIPPSHTTTTSSSLSTQLTTDPLPQQEQDGQRSHDHMQKRSTSNPQLITVDLGTQKRIIYLFICMIVFISVASITTYGCYSILCKAHGFKTIQADEKCMKLCDRAKCLRVCPDYL